uniref:Transcription repressor n=1 Tax=Kalanchoe fedtschenkoi TaxID=63787 RepID=A0A7N0U8J3_KALFE
MFSSRKKLLKGLSAVHAGCGCSSKSHEIKDSLQTRPREQPAGAVFLSPTSSSISDLDNIDTDGTMSDNKPSPPSVARIENSVAVEKHSDDPYSDFKDSMLQMILDNKGIYSKQDLQKLLTCFLQLNSPAHHPVIIRAFMEILSSISWTPSSNNP